MTGTDNPVQL